MALGQAPEFGDEFLAWFRERTEAAWAPYAGGGNWQPGTRWLGGLSERQIVAIERERAIAFPPDYRLFLRRLHADDRPMRGAHFTNWLTDAEELRDRLAWLHEGLEFDVEHNVLWPESWGPKPAALDAQKRRVRELVAAAPRLIPVFGHRYLVASPRRPGNPVLSVYQSDIIVYGYDLRSYLLFEFYDLLGLDRKQLEREIAATIQARFETYTSIPFWGEFL